MPIAAIPFPAIDPVLIQIGPLAIRWYALAYIAGLMIGWIYAVRLARQDRLWGGTAPFSKQTLDDFLLWAALGIILGGRLGYVLFYNFDHYLANPLEIFAIWRGGMSFHGGVLGIGVAIFAFCARNNLPALRLMDLAAAVSPVGLFFGRIANFINAELYGRATEMPWGVIFPGAGPMPRHPSQLYEAALEGIVLFLILNWLIRYRLILARPGYAIGAFLALYSLARAFVELFRMPDAHIGFLWGGLTMGIVLSLPMLLIGLALIARARSLPPAAK
jgi:phosphatidylglycerol:prolipoprotein diacylglycerol transferase